MENLLKKPANQDQVTLYCLIGEALCAIQVLEDAISCSITLKKHVKVPSSITEEEANKIRKDYTFYPLGKAIKLIKDEKLYFDIILNDLVNLQHERNWLVHRCTPESTDNAGKIINKNHLFGRIKSITDNAQKLVQAITTDLISYSEFQGIDMSKVKDAIIKFYEMP